MPARLLVQLGLGALLSVARVLVGVQPASEASLMASPNCDGAGTRTHAAGEAALPGRAAPSLRPVPPGG